MTVLPISNLVQVNIRSTPSNLSEINVNNLLLLTTEMPDNNDEYRSYLNARQVGVDYGTDSEAYALANSIFSQPVNLLTGNGKLIIAPLTASVSATRGKFVTATLTSNLNNLKAIANGDIRVVLNGTNIDLTGLDFTNCTTIAQIGDVMQRRLPDITVSTATNKITFESKTVGLSSTVDLVQLPAGAGTDLSTSTRLNVAGGTATAGVNSSGETIVAAIARLTDKVSFTPIISDLLVENAVAISTATAIEALKKMWFYCWSSTTDLDGVITTINAAGNNKTRTLLYTGVAEALNFMAAYASAGCSVNFNGSNTFVNANTQLRSLNGISVDDGITQAVYDKCQTLGAASYDNFGITGITNGRYGDTGLFFDQVYGRLAIEFAAQVSVFNALRSGGVTQTPAGIDIIISALNSVYSRFVRVGYIGVGLNWNSPLTFGNPTDLRNSINAAGYYIYANPIADQLQSERESRDAPLTQSAYKEAGFIYRASVDVLVEA